MITLQDFNLTLDLEIDATWQRGYRGARERSSGIQLEPDEPAGYEIRAIYAVVDGKELPVDITNAISTDDYQRIQEMIDEQGSEEGS